jgi:L-ribulose-5-phosphate 3-epimerase UlaE
MLLAKQSPWSVVYPTLVDLNAYEEKPSEELQHILGCLVMEFAFLSLLETYVHFAHYNMSDIKKIYPSFGNWACKY